jgi:hypothetical protein
MGFRKLTDTETANIIGRNAKHATPLMTVVKQFYSTPQDAVSAIIQVESEYDDEYHNNRVGYVGIYNSEGHEIYPTPGREREARKALWDAAGRSGAFDEQTEDSLDDVVVRLGSPELYVKE